MNNLRWESQRGDEWWHGDATATYFSNTFTIDDFGEDATSALAIALIKGAIDQFSDCQIKVYLTKRSRRLMDQIDTDILKWHADAGLRTATIVDVNPSARQSRRTID